MILKGGDTRLKKAASTIAAMKPNQFNNGAVGGQYFLFLIFLISSLSHLFFEHLFGCHFSLCFTVIQNIAEAVLFTKSMVSKLLHVSYHYFTLSEFHTFIYFFLYLHISFEFLPLSSAISLYLSMYLFIYLSIYFPLSHTHSPSTSLSFSVSISFFLSTSLSLFLSFCFSLFLSLSLSFSLILCVSLFHCLSYALSYSISK